MRIRKRLLFLRCWDLRVYLSLVTSVPQQAPCVALGRSLILSLGFVTCTAKIKGQVQIMFESWMTDFHGPSTCSLPMELSLPHCPEAGSDLGESPAGDERAGAKDEASLAPLATPLHQRLPLIEMRLRLLPAHDRWDGGGGRGTCSCCQLEQEEARNQHRHT